MVRRVLALGLIACAAAAASADEAAPPGALSKKEQFLAEKAARKPVRRSAAPRAGAAATAPVSLVNLWTQEVLPIDPAQAPAEPEVDRFLRCHDTNQAAAMDPRLLGVVLAAAAKFKSAVIEIVSAYRAPKYQLQLRKKGHEVARDSQHPLGHAVDFRVPGLPTRTLLRFVRTLRRGGVGYYPDSAFVHADTGPLRFWRGH